MSCPHGNPISGCDTCDEVDAAFEAGKRSAMAEQQKPVAIVASHPERIDWLRDEPPDGTLLCTTPAQRKPLTDEFLRKLHHVDQFGLFCDYDDFEQIARAIEAAHGIKENT